MSEEKRVKLNGKTNYLGWQRVMTAELFEKTYSDKKGKIAEGKEDLAYCLVMKSLSLSVAQVVRGDTGTKLLDWLKKEYGSNDAIQAKKNLKSVKMRGIDLQDFWEQLNLALTSFEAAGGNMDMVDVMEIALDNIHEEFYLEVIRKHRLVLGALTDATQTHMDNLRKDLVDHFNATPESVRDKFSRVPRFKSNHVRESSKLCKLCEKHNRWRIKTTHDTSNCRIGDVHGWGPNPKSNHVEEEQKGNKGNEPYLAFHDTGSTPYSFFKDKPKNMNSKKSQVRVANNKSVDIVGEGTIKFGDLELKNVQYGDRIMQILSIV
jgi:hypothetical protein